MQNENKCPTSQSSTCTETLVIVYSLIYIMSSTRLCWFHVPQPVTEDLSVPPPSHNTALVLVPASLEDKGAAGPLYLRGSLIVQSVLVGTLEANGWTVTPESDSPFHVYSPREENTRGYSLCKLQFRPPHGDDQVVLSQLEQKVRALNFDFKAMKDVLKVWQKGQYISAVTLSQYMPPWAPPLQDLIPQMYPSWSSSKVSLFGRDPKLQTEKDASMDKALNVNLLTLDEATASGARLFQEDEQWNVAVQSVLISLKEKGHSRLLAAGGKGVGKSSFLKYVANRVLLETNKPILWVDLDPGQAEFTLPGCVSLSIVTLPVSGPNFCHLGTEQQYIHNLGEVNASNCKDSYLAAVDNLSSVMLSDPKYASYPVFINSMGFNRGLGELFMRKTLQYFKPTIVGNIKSAHDAKNYSNVNFKHPDQVYLEFTAMPESVSVKMRATEGWGIPEPRVMRNIVVGAGMIGLHTGNGLYLQIPLKEEKVGFQILHHNGAPLNSVENILRLFNGSLVSLGIVPDSALTYPKRLNSSSKLKIRCARPMALNECLGFGIVQCACNSEGNLILLTNISLEKMATVNCISIGAVRLPDAFYNVTKGKSEPYVAKKHDDRANPLAEEWKRHSKPKNIF